jgi:transcriptional regulator with XRE-family HTH domain
MSKSKHTLDTLRPMELARTMRISQPYASLLLAGKRLPSLALAIAIERELGIPPSAWIKPEPVEAA